MCNESIIDLGAGQIDFVDGIGTCSPSVVMQHNSGCPVFSSSQVLKFLSNNKWFTGTVLLISGALIMWNGWKLFKEVMASVSSVLLFFTLLTLMGIYNSPESLFTKLIISIMLSASFWYMLYKF
jgi:hypothetical protein